MLVAKDENGERVKAPKFKSAHEIRSLYKSGSLRCPRCEEVVFPRERTGFILHFFHRTQCQCNYEYHPESAEHDQGKLQIAKYLKQHELRNNTKGVNIEVEYVLPQCGSHGRIADVALVYDNGNLMICECQLCSISIDDLRQRTKDYWEIGADVLWFLGKDANTPENHSWLRDIFGASFEISFNYNRSTIEIQ